MLVYVYDHTHSVTWLAAASILRFLPYVLLSTFGGVLADRYDRRRLMITIDVARGLLIGPRDRRGARRWRRVPDHRDHDRCRPRATRPHLPCVQASTPAVVGEDDLAGANAVVTIVDTLALALGPVLAGLLLLGGHTSLAFGINGASFFVSALLVALIRTPLSVVPDESDAEAEGSFLQRARASASQP